VTPEPLGSRLDPCPDILFEAAYSRPPGTAELRDAVPTSSDRSPRSVARRFGMVCGWYESSRLRTAAPGLNEMVVAKRLACLRDPGQDLARKQRTANRLVKFNPTDLAPAAAKVPTDSQCPMKSRSDNWSTRSK